MPKVEEVPPPPKCVDCKNPFASREKVYDCPCCGDEGFCYSCEDQHSCGKNGCRRCAAPYVDDPDSGPWCSPCRAEVAGGVDIDLDQGGPVKVLSHGLHGPRAVELGGPVWLEEAASDLESLARKLRAAASAISAADAPRALALGMMGEGLPAEWNERKEAVEIRGLEPALARKLAEDYGWILKGPGFTPTEWEQMRAKDAAKRN